MNWQKKRTGTNSCASALISDYDSSSALLDGHRRPPLIPFGVYGDQGGVPLPTLYNGNGGGNGHAVQGGGLSFSSSSGGPFGPPETWGSNGGGRRMGAIELLLYNMASMLAGVAAGYDVRLSNVSPMHPRLHPTRYSLASPKFYRLVKGLEIGNLNCNKYLSTQDRR